MLNRISIVSCFLFLFFVNVVKAQKSLTLWYDKPAVNWMTSALPIGNGELGAMFFGSVAKEQLQFNEKTLWTGSTTIRGAYQNFGYVYIDFTGHENYTQYRRELSLNNAMGNVAYKINDVVYNRTYFASRPDGVIVMRIKAPGKKGKISFSLSLKDAHSGIKESAKNKLTISGKLDLLNYEGQVKVLNEGGSLSSSEGKITVANADAVTILIAAATNYKIENANYIGETKEELNQRLNKVLSSASAKTYEELKARHLEDYQRLFNRVKFDLKIPEPKVTTDVLLKSQRQNNYLDALYFQYGRYLMISSSRGIQLPNNLQGIWNNSNTPPWESDIHTNINIQMNYWPAESTNLSECHLPFINYVKTEALRDNGSFVQLAKSENNRGWTVNTQSNIFGHTDWNINRPANAWYATHLWQHYAYTKDLTYLKNTAFPVLKSTCEYWFDRLVNNANGKLVAPKEWSPEHGPWEDGVAYAQQLVWELFDQTLKASEVLNADAKFVAELKDKFARLDNGLEVGKWGQIKEWKIDGQNLDKQGYDHRHLSHLIALYPGSQISYLKDAKFAEAARVTLESRGDEGMGWSRAWKIACWARLFDGDRAHKLLRQALNLTYKTQLSMNVADGGVYENLLDAHPPFQIDGNFGATASIAEMLLQSHLNEIHLLPSLPKAWATGSINGLKAQGNFEINMQWNKGLLQKAFLTSLSGSNCKIRTQIPITIKNQQYKSEKDGKYFVYSFDTVKGKQYKIVSSL